MYRDFICVNIKHSLIKYCEKENILKPKEVAFLKSKDIEIEFSFCQSGVWIGNKKIGVNHNDMRSNGQKQKEITQKIANHFNAHDLYKKTHHFNYRDSGLDILHFKTEAELTKAKAENNTLNFNPKEHNTAFEFMATSSATHEVEKARNDYLPQIESFAKETWIEEEKSKSFKIKSANNAASKQKKEKFNKN